MIVSNLAIKWVSVKDERLPCGDGKTTYLVFIPFEVLEPTILTTNSPCQYHHASHWAKVVHPEKDVQPELFAIDNTTKEAT